VAHFAMTIADLRLKLVDLMVEILHLFGEVIDVEITYIVCFRDRCSIEVQMIIMSEK
jgi:hypothetical protein